MYSSGNVRDDPQWNCDDDWESFSRFWENLELDPHMGDGGTYRRRKYSTISYEPGSDTIRLVDHDGFLQSREINRLNGGVVRRFEPVDPALLGMSVVHRLLARFTRHIADTARPARPVAPGGRVNIHQHRITATGTQLGNPTPEGIHRDGVEHIVMMLVARKNVAGGSSTLHDNAGTPVFTRTLTDPGDYIFLDDRTCLHSTSPVTVAPPAAQGYRDMFFLEFC
ncbi:2OG-Fe dioxygenase family protein [Kitasatospora sp. NBC_01266]|uniref:2OG-Fe dioxygenase family protein n=1 Tax=Kitasatospora sp. NBC_01266 TaxID=2903572 RepID=UPI002E34600F|nr:2OG-Fe dioxygenase family protein [Kitasatospora sp. NBC_01266]